MKTKLMITGLLATALIAAPIAPAFARSGHGGHQGSYHSSYRHHDGRNDAAAGLFLGLAALTTFAVIANAHQPPPPPVYYAAPQPVYYYAPPQRRVVYSYPTQPNRPAPAYYHAPYYAR